jgi:hypothetical protein
VLVDLRSSGHRSRHEAMPYKTTNGYAIVGRRPALLAEQE